MFYVDIPFYLAIAAIGFGLSLMTYRIFARHYEWPMGSWQTKHPTLPILIGLVALLYGSWFAYSRWYDGMYASLAIGAFGLALAILWTSFMRVASQISLFLAPAAVATLFVAWTFGTQALEYHSVRSEIRELRQQLQDQYGLKQRDIIPPKSPLN